MNKLPTVLLSLAISSSAFATPTYAEQKKQISQPALTVLSNVVTSMMAGQQGPVSRIRQGWVGSAKRVTLQGKVAMRFALPHENYFLKEQGLSPIGRKRPASAAETRAVFESILPRKRAPIPYSLSGLAHDALRLEEGQKTRRFEGGAITVSAASSGLLIAVAQKGNHHQLVLDKSGGVTEVGESKLSSQDLTNVRQAVLRGLLKKPNSNRKRPRTRTRPTTK
jgi:hypothetical protein